MKLLGTISAHGGSVVVGRGAQYILAPETALRVRVVSLFEARVRGYAQRHSLDEVRARAEVERSDAERLHFVRKLFSRDAAVASDYDVIVNTGTFDLEQAAGIVLEAYRAKFGRQPAVSELRTLSVAGSAP